MSARLTLARNRHFLASHCRTFSTRLGSLQKTFEPSYLDSAGDLPPILPAVNIQIRGYDYHVLEKYQGFVHKLCKKSGIPVNTSWATPCSQLEVETFKPGGTNVKDTYNLNLYERNIQLTKLRSVDVGFLLDLLVRSLPPGVSLSTHEHKEEHDEARVIHDPFLHEIKTEIQQYELDKESTIVQAQAKKEQKEQKKKENILASLE